MNRCLNTVIAASLLSAWGTSPSCTSEANRDTHVQEEVTELQKRTVPPDSRQFVQHSLTIQGSVAHADWGFQTDLSADAYNRWVANELRPDFQGHEGASSPTRFTKYSLGDVEMLSVVTSSSGGMLWVAVKLEIYPD